ncbi:AraC family transcriptional regulator [Halomonas sp. HK25]|uniref:AraC family transcriptional regulator n=1 Tax=Halomonas sp. HK25 TaxID=3394321 RepID=UPI0039FCD111
MSGCQMSRLKLFGADWGEDVIVRSSPLLCWHGIRPLSGAVECHAHGLRALAGELLLFAPGHEMHLRWQQDTRAVVFSLPPDKLSEHVETYHQSLMASIADRGWHIGRGHPALRSMAMLHDMLAAEIDNPAGLAASEAARQQWQSLCCENLLQLLPELRRGPSPVPVPGMVQRAREYIHAHLEAPLDMAELVKVSATSRRSLEQAFRHSLQTSPVRYHRQRRLEALRDLLQRHCPEDLQLAELAYRWGFSQPSHFTASYKHAFGELPSETLARSPCRPLSPSH